MYQVKRLILEILEKNTIGSSAEIPSIMRTATEALEEIKREIQEQIDGPQEMRDVFAAAALLKVNADTKERLVERCWDISDAMMLERALRIKAREVAGETKKHDN